MIKLVVENGEVTDIENIENPDVELDEYDIYDGKYGDIYVSIENPDIFINSIIGYKIYEDSNDGVIREIKNTFKGKEGVLAYKLIEKYPDFAKKLLFELELQL